MGLFHKSAEKEKLEALEKVISKTNRGIFKRIDENRELLELLYEKAPELMDKCFWIRCWIESQDEFLSKLAEISGVENRTYNLTPDKPYPRPFPKKPDCLMDSSNLFVIAASLLRHFWVIYQSVKIQKGEVKSSRFVIAPLMS
ncbi:TPA: hypothetical protein ACXGW1_003639 [Escherichia coli]